MITHVFPDLPSLCNGQSKSLDEYIKIGAVLYSENCSSQFALQETLKALVEEILRHKAINNCQSNDSLVLETDKNSGKALRAVFFI